MKSMLFTAHFKLIFEDYISVNLMKIITALKFNLFIVADFEFHL